ncbi:MAG: 23S rRNA (guanosine(2251)-2'-O)-methyltransferase RlmB [Pseudomonadota bacterium]|nr:23S rRNA (guanosine(2251)-2'-O)-methyltransferase RlmB [Pseudomonadota bacterium]
MKNRKPGKHGGRPDRRGERPQRKQDDRARGETRAGKPFRRRDDDIARKGGDAPSRPGRPGTQAGDRAEAKREQPRGRRQARTDARERTGAADKGARPETRGAHESGRPDSRERPQGKRPDKRPTSRAEIRAGGAPQLWIYGRHAVVAALKNPERQIKRLLATTSGAEWLRSQRVPQARLATATGSSLEAIDAVLHEGAVHQGLAAMVADLPRSRLKETCAPDGSNRPVVVLDQITDPQNIGAIFRSAAAFGARAIIVQDRRTPPLAGALAKAAAGAVEIVPCVDVVNVARALEALKGLGYFCAGLSGEADKDLAAMPADRPVALVLGAEGAGLRQLVASTCDGLFRIPIARAIESLNVSTAAAVSLYAVTQRRG